MEKNQEILLILQEECAEVTQAVSKCFRFGFDNTKPGEEKTNRQHLAEEIGDLLCMVELIVTNDIIDENEVMAALQEKQNKLKKWSTVYK